MTRLWSDYTFQRKLDLLRSRTHYDDYLSACERRKRDGSDTVKDGMHGLYIGYFGDYVPLWLDGFGPDIKVLFTEDLSRDPVAVMRACSGGWTSMTTSQKRLDLDPRNPTLHPRSRRLAHLAYSVKKSAERRDRLSRMVKSSAVGSPCAGSRALDAEAVRRLADPSDTRRHIEELYAESTALTRRRSTASLDELPPGA